MSSLAEDTPQVGSLLELFIISSLSPAPVRLYFCQHQVSVFWFNQTTDCPLADLLLGDEPSISLPLLSLLSASSPSLSLSS